MPPKQPSKPTKAAKTSKSSKTTAKPKSATVPRGTRDKSTNPTSTKHTQKRRTPPKPTNKPHREIEIIARGVLTRHGRVLLSQNLKHGYFYLPGGHVEFAESAAKACAREFLEECGVSVRVGPLLLASEGVFATPKRQHHEINLVFHVEHLPTPAPGYPTPESLDRIQSLESNLGIEWIDLAAIVDLDLRPATVKAFLVAGPAAQTTPGSAPQPLTEWHSEVSTAT